MQREAALVSKLPTKTPSTPETRLRALATRTRESSDTGSPSPGVEIPVLTILWHADPSRVGACAWLLGLEEGRNIGLSRLEPLFSLSDGDGEPFPLAEPRVSRKPIWLSPHPEGILLTTGKELSPVEINSVLVENTQLLSDSELSRGVVLLIGGRVVLFLQRRSPVALRPPRFGMVGESAAMMMLRRQIEAVADLDLPVLLRGESGTGKELVARAIQRHGHRRGEPFLTLNMAAVPISLAASELFGAIKGAFSGAEKTRPGYFKQVDGGTLFLDEIGEAPRELQGLLLRVLESGEIQPVGAGPSEIVDVRVIAATDADLEAGIEEGTFTNPLLRRLQGLEIRLPSLRERIEDLGRLFFHFLSEELSHLGEEERLSFQGPFVRPFVPARLVARMAHHSWPGNVRELHNEVRRLVVVSRGADTLATDPWLRSPSRVAAMPEAAACEAGNPSSFPSPQQSRPTPKKPSYREPSSIRDAELLTALLDHDWNIKATAETLGISRTSLYARIRESPGIRKANELEAGEIEEALECYGRNLEAVAQSLRVSKQGLKRQIKRLKI